MKFRFRLEKILHYREAQMNVARKKFLEADADLRAAQSLLDQFHLQIDAAQRERQNVLLCQDRPSESLSQIYQYIKGTEIKIERQKKVIEERMVKVESAQLALQEASIEYKMIERLREKQLGEHRKVLRKREEKEISELTIQRLSVRQEYEE